MYVTPLPRPKYLGFAPVCTERTGTTKRIPSAEASSPPPKAFVSGSAACEAVVGGRDRVGANVALLDPRQSSTCQRRNLRAHKWLETDVAGLGQKYGTHADRQIVSTRTMLIDVREVRSEASRADWS